MKVRVPSHRVGNRSVFSPGAYPEAKPVTLAPTVADGWFCTLCLCVLRERAVHPGCRATPEQMAAHVKTQS